MKPFHFYEVRQFPNLTLTNPMVSAQLQRTLFGENESIDTSIHLVKPGFHGSLSKLKVRSGIQRHDSGYHWKIINKKPQKVRFDGFIKPVKFDGYHDKERQVIFFQAPKSVCRGLLLNLEGGSSGVQLSEMEVDFAKAYDICPRYSAVWFKDISSYVRSAGLSGHQLQNDTLFKSMATQGQLSSVVISWNFMGDDHPIMLTGFGGIVLVNSYEGNAKVELQIVVDVYDKLLSKVWRIRKKKNGRSDLDSILEPDGSR